MLSMLPGSICREGHAQSPATKNALKQSMHWNPTQGFLDAFIFVRKNHALGSPYQTGDHKMQAAQVVARLLTETPRWGRSKGAYLTNVHHTPQNRFESSSVITSPMLHGESQGSKDVPPRHNPRITQPAGATALAVATETANHQPLHG